MIMTSESDNEDDGIAQVFCLGAPLRLVAAYSKRGRRAHKPGDYHYLEIEAGTHVITIESSPSGKIIRVMMDGKELS
jgi:hypothetical protein